MNQLYKLLLINPSKLNTTMSKNAMRTARRYGDVLNIFHEYSDNADIAAIVYNVGGGNVYDVPRPNKSEIKDTYDMMIKYMGHRAHLFIMSPPAEHNEWQKTAREINIHIKTISAISPFITEKLFQYTFNQKITKDVAKEWYNTYANASSVLTYGKYLEYYKLEDQYNIVGNVYPCMHTLSDNINPTIYEYMDIMNYNESKEKFRHGAYEFMHAYNNIEYPDVIFIKNNKGYFRLDVLMRGREIMRVLYCSEVYDNFREIKNPIIIGA